MNLHIEVRQPQTLRGQLIEIRCGSAADYSTQKATLLASFTKTQTSYDAWRGRIEDELFQLPEITAPT